MQCFSCQTENPDRAKFCMDCGARFGVSCSECGSALPENARFCINCGAPAGAEQAATPAATSSQAERTIPTPQSYTPHHLARKILRSKAALEGERKQVTVLFADVTESMRLAEMVDPETWHEILDGFFSILSGGIHRYEGTINQYTGDGIMALFGAPIAHEDHAHRACYAALGLNESLREYSDEIRRRHGLDFSVRIGINSGEVVVGRIGDDLRMDYTAQGHTVGLAARIEGLAAPNTTYITENTAALVRGYFRLRDLGAFELKGVSGTTGVFELEGLGDARTRLDISKARGFSRFVGRESEMRVLEDALEIVAGGGRRVLGIVADAGSGKSRLCYEFLERCRARGVRVLEGHCLAHGEMIPYLPVLELLRGFFEIKDGDSDRAAREKIAGRALLMDDSLKESLPLLFDFLGYPDPDRPAPQLEAEARRNQLFGVLGRLLQSVDDHEPEVVLVEDLHWIDGASEYFLKGLVELLGAATKTLLIVNSRPGYDRSWLEIDDYEEIALAPLDGSAVLEILRDLLGADPSVRGLADRVRAETAGNPFFVEEVVRTLIETGKLTGEPGAYLLSNPYDEIAIPATVHGVLAARIDRLEDELKDVLAHAAVIGKRFDEALLAEVMEPAIADLGVALARLEEAGFVEQTAVAPHSEYAFCHPLTQEVAYRTQLGERRKVIHKRVGLALEDDCRCERPEESAALLAHHWEQAGDTLKAVTWSMRAAEWATTRDVAESRRHWQKVMELLDGCTDCDDSYQAAIAARRALIEVNWKLGADIEETRRLFEEGLALAHARDDRTVAAGLEASFAMAQLFVGRVEDGLMYLERAVETASKSDDLPLNLQLVSRLAYMQLLTGHLNKAAELFDLSLKMIEDADAAEPGRYAKLVAESTWGVGFRALPMMYLGRYTEAADVHASALVAVREADERGTQTTMYGIGVTLSWFLGEAEAALDFARKQLLLAEEVGVPTLRAGAFDSMAVALMMSERYGEALDYSKKALSTARDSGTLLQSEAVFLSNLCAAYTGIGDIENAVAVGEEAVESARNRRTPMFEIRARLYLARALMRIDLARAEQVLKEALELIETSDARGYEPFIREELARTYHRGGDDAQCTRETEAARRLFEHNGAPTQFERVGREPDLCIESSDPATIH